MGIPINGAMANPVNFSKDQKKQVDSYFNGDGKIDYDENNAFIKYADADGNGKVSGKEKKAACNGLNGNDSEVQKLKDIYSTLLGTELP